MFPAKLSPRERRGRKHETVPLTKTTRRAKIMLVGMGITIPTSQRDATKIAISIDGMCS